MHCLIQFHTTAPHGHIVVQSLSESCSQMVANCWMWQTARQYGVKQRKKKASPGARPSNLVSLGTINSALSRRCLLVDSSSPNSISSQCQFTVPPLFLLQPSLHTSRWLPQEGRGTGNQIRGGTVASKHVRPPGWLNSPAIRLPPATSHQTPVINVEPYFGRDNGTNLGS